MLFAGRYSSGGVGDEYMRLAQRWLDALSRDDLEPNELRGIIADAERYEYRCDIAFYGFITEMRSVYRNLWEDYLSMGPKTGVTNRDP